MSNLLLFKWIHQFPYFRCDKYSGSIGFPSERINESNNFVGANDSPDESKIWLECPEKCRRKDHLEWKFC